MHNQIWNSSLYRVNDIVPSFALLCELISRNWFLGPISPVKVALLVLCWPYEKPAPPNKWMGMVDFANSALRSELVCAVCPVRVCEQNLEEEAFWECNFLHQMVQFTVRGTSVLFTPISLSGVTSILGIPSFFTNIPLHKVTYLFQADDTCSGFKSGHRPWWLRY